MEAIGGFGLHERQVVTHARNAALIGERAMPWHNGLNVHAQHQVARIDPVGQWPRPHNGGATDEQDVTGVHGLGIGNIGNDIACGVRWANLDEFDHSATNLDVEPTFEGTRRQGVLNSFEVEFSEEATKQFANFAGRFVERGQHRRRHFGHLMCGSLAGDDLGTLHQLVAIAMIAVGVRVDQRANRCSIHHARH